MAAIARKARPKSNPPRRRGALWEALAVFAAAGAVAYVTLGAAPEPGAEPFTPMALVPDHLKPVDHHFQGCNQARAKGMTDIPAWHPSYREFMDRDRDGFACEPYYGD